ncbi:MAG: AAA family ATPase, partial [Proteobacteria bacterium]|nr:AAA family ATPase [Pseudomonadota bacterium]
MEIISYGAAEAALEALRETCDNPTGLSLLQGPSLSGKSTLIRTFVDSLHNDSAVAVVNGTGLNTTNLLISVMHHFGYDVELSSANELLGLVRVFVLQQAASGEPPLLIIENTHELNPSALRALCELAALRVQTCRALKLVLVSDRSLATMMAVPAMEPMSKRILHDFHLRPMTRNETQDFLHSKLRAAGANNPELIFPDE